MTMNVEQSRRDAVYRDVIKWWDVGVLIKDNVDVMMSLGSATDASSSVDSSVANTPDTDESCDVCYLHVLIFTAVYLSATQWYE